MLKKVTTLLSPAQLRAFIINHPNHILKGELNGFEIEFLHCAEHATGELPILVRFVKENLLIRVKRFPLTITVERYMTREECMAWISIIGFKGYQVRVSTDSIWRYPTYFNFGNEIEHYEYRTVDFVNSELVCGEPEEFKTEIKENIALVKSLEASTCDICEVPVPLSVVYEFTSSMKDWSTANLCEYIEKYIGYRIPQHTTYEDILKDYFAAYALGSTTHNLNLSNRRRLCNPSNKRRHCLITFIYKFLLEKRRLPELSDIKAKDTTTYLYARHAL
jgi:hypothetical protein